MKQQAIGILRHLPVGLAFLAEPAMKFGTNQTDDAQFEFLRDATPADRRELAEAAEKYRLSDLHDEVGDFLDEYPIDKYHESANLYFLFGLMDAAGLKIDGETAHSVAGYVKRLKKHGNFRIASERAIAALMLSRFGDEGRQAIPLLREALTDEDLRVRAWANYTLAYFEGNIDKHEHEIREIINNNARTLKDEYVNAAAQAALEKITELKRR